MCVCIKDRPHFFESLCLDDVKDLFRCHGGIWEVLKNLFGEDRKWRSTFYLWDIYRPLWLNTFTLTMCVRSKSRLGSDQQSQLATFYSSNSGLPFISVIQPYSLKNLQSLITCIYSHLFAGYYLYPTLPRVLGTSAYNTAKTPSQAKNLFKWTLLQSQ